METNGLRAAIEKERQVILPRLKRYEKEIEDLENDVLGDGQTHIARHWRGMLGRIKHREEAARQLLIKQTKATRKIQRYERGRRGRRRRNWIAMMFREAASVDIQRL